MFNAVHLVIEIPTLEVDAALSLIGFVESMGSNCGSTSTGSGTLALSVD